MPVRQSCLAIGNLTPLSNPKILDEACQVIKAGTKMQSKYQRFVTVFHRLTLLWLSSKVDIQLVHLGMSYLQRGTFVMAYIKNGGREAWDAMTFCHREVGVPGVLPTWDVDRTSWQDMAASWKDTCVPRSTWIEYKGTSNLGSGLWDMVKWDLRTSQLAWETQSCVFWPLTEANSKGPWMKVSRCVKFSLFQKEHSLWCWA